MKHLLLFILVVGACGSQAVATTTQPQDISVGVSATFGDAGGFYGSLSPYGEWLELDGGFYAWHPSHVQVGWRPYLYGRWAWTDYGWYWVSSEPFGWAVFHYGRWYYDDYYGWIWIPDNTWGPAWVEWRYNDDYLGWAPLPPYASFSMSFGIRFTTQWFAPHHYWNFVHYRRFASPYVDREVVSTEYARRLIGTTRSAGRYDVDGDRIINRGVDRSFVERRGGYTRIERVDVRTAGSPGERVVRDRNQDRIEVYRPDRSSLSRSGVRIDARQADRATSLDLQRVERAPREAIRSSQPKASDRTQRSTAEESRAPQSRVQVQTPPTDRRQIDRNSDNRYPFQNRQQAQPQQERRSVTPARPQPETRREVAPPRTRTEQSRPAPNVSRESPRGSEQGRREGGRKRN